MVGQEPGLVVLVLRQLIQSESVDWVRGRGNNSKSEGGRAIRILHSKDTAQAQNFYFLG
jgi:hypothetical protein